MVDFPGKLGLNPAPMSEHHSGRDEKGLTLSGRTMLRLLSEFGRLLSASMKIGNKPGYEVLQTPTIISEIRTLLWMASEIAKRVGPQEELEAYLAKHAKADEKVVLEGMSKAGTAFFEEALAYGGVSKCTICGKLMCPICQCCHNCEKREEHQVSSTPFDLSKGGGAPN